MVQSAECSCLWLSRSWYRILALVTLTNWSLNCSFWCAAVGRRRTCYFSPSEGIKNTGFRSVHCPQWREFCHLSNYNNSHNSHTLHGAVFCHRTNYNSHTWHGAMFRHRTNYNSHISVQNELHSGSKVKNTKLKTGTQTPLITAYKMPHCWSRLAALARYSGREELPIKNKASLHVCWRPIQRVTWIKDASIAMSVYR